MNQPATASPKSLLEEYAAELTPQPDELLAALGPAPRRAAPAAEPPRKAAEEAAPARNLDMVLRIPVTVKIVLGSATMPVANLLKLGCGAIIALDRRVGAPVDMMVNGRLVARGEVVVVDEATSRLGIKLTEVAGPATEADKAA